MMAGDASTRASDDERSRTVDRLQQAHVEGRLTSDEAAERIEAALRAKTRGDLTALTQDLPGTAPGAVVPVPQPDAPASKHRRKDSLTAAWTSWAVASSVTFVVWLITAVTAGSYYYPWFLWVAGPWGAVLLATTISRKFTDDR
jgi:hypothetical protein